MAGAGTYFIDKVRNAGVRMGFSKGKNVEIKQKIDELKKRFLEMDGWEDRYKLVIEMGEELEPMPEELKIADNLVKGCISQVWLVSSLNEGKIVFQADSDAAITRGIISMLIKVYSNESPEAIITTPPDFLDDIGIKESLSMNRANGLTSMLKQIQFYAVAYSAKLKQES